MLVARAPRRAWEVIVSIAKTVEPFFFAMPSRAQVEVCVAFRKVFSGALLVVTSDDSLTLASQRCRSELSAMASCMLDGVASARATIENSELAVATTDAGDSISAPALASPLRI